MFRFLSPSNLINYLLIVLYIVYAAIDEVSGIDIINVLWILLVLLYFLIPTYFYSGRYISFILGWIGLLVLGIIILEGFIEEDGQLSDFLDPWTWTHELPLLLWPTMFIVLGKISADLTLKQYLMVALEKERAQSESKFLKSQLNPHVLFNNLNNIYSFALHGSNHTPTLILKLADIMRYMLYETQEDKVPLDKELAHLDSYVELQRIQLENRGTLVYEKKGEIDHLMIAPMMLISFVENCFKHASSSTIEDLKIIIHIEVNENEIILFTENSYTKKEIEDEEDTLQIGGIGLSNVKRRLALLYPEKHTLINKELTNLYVVNLTIQLDRS